MALCLNAAWSFVSRCWPSPQSLHPYHPYKRVRLYTIAHLHSLVTTMNYGRWVDSGIVNHSASLKDFPMLSGAPARAAHPCVRDDYPRTVAVQQDLNRTSRPGDCMAPRPVYAYGTTHHIPDKGNSTVPPRARAHATAPAQSYARVVALAHPSPPHRLAAQPPAQNPLAMLQAHRQHSTLWSLTAQAFYPAGSAAQYAAPSRHAIQIAAPVPLHAPAWKPLATFVHQQPPWNEQDQWAHEWAHGPIRPFSTIERHHPTSTIPTPPHSEGDYRAQDDLPTPTASPSSQRACTPPKPAVCDHATCLTAVEVPLPTPPASPVSSTRTSPSPTPAPLSLAKKLAVSLTLDDDDCLLWRASTAHLITLPERDPCKYPEHVLPLSWDTVHALASFTPWEFDRAVCECVRCDAGYQVWKKRGFTAVLPVL
jgi:hypothetical protein